LAFAKKSQIGGIIASDRFDEVKDHVFAQSSRISSTFSGNLVDAVRCQRILEVFEEEDVLGNVRSQGAYLLDELRGLEKKYPFLSRARGVGVLLAIDAESRELRNRIIDAAYDEKLIVLPCGDRSIRLRPAPDVRRQDCEEAIRRLSLALERATKE